VFEAPDSLACTTALRDAIAIESAIFRTLVVFKKPRAPRCPTVLASLVIAPDVRLPWVVSFPNDAILSLRLLL